MTDDDWINAEFVSEGGRVLTRRQMGYAMWKRGAEVTPVEDGGYIVDGTLYRPVED